MDEPVTHKTPIGPAMVLHPDTYYKLVSTIESLNQQVAELEAENEKLTNALKVVVDLMQEMNDD